MRLLVANRDVDKDAREKDGQIALAVAAHKGIVEGVRLVLNAGADSTLRDARSPPRTALSRAGKSLGKPDTDVAREIGI